LVSWIRIKQLSLSCRWGYYHAKIIHCYTEKS
jgi:hypothetical protein